ncbi:MAG TPA: histidine triad nucleotide-binding protein [Fimbriimonas sp.]|nr:histidine triad nucleotide-binding protein [Fimbriimonas sp.]
MATLFTKILNGEIPAEIIYQDENVFAIKDISPQAPVHVLIIPKKEVTGVSAVEVGDGTETLLLAARKVAEQLGITNGYRLVINEGEDGAQTVSHLHVHLLAGRKLSWPPG